jgi:hypothetical protein
LNELRISGRLEGIAEHTAKTGDAFVTGRLLFNPAAGESILILAVGARVAQLNPFDNGDNIVVRGRLVLVKDGFAVLIDECARWAIAKNRKFTYDANQAGKAVKELCEVSTGDARHFGNRELGETYRSDVAKGQKPSWR